MTHKRIAQIADLLRRTISVGTMPVLPPVRAIAAQCHCSPNVVCKALGLLQAEGLISRGRGKRVQIQGRMAVPAVVSSAPLLGHGARTSAIALCKELERRIRDGTYRFATPLPKRLFFATEFGVAERTVSKACRMLEAGGLICRNRTQWLVGRIKTQTPRARNARSEGSILIVQAEDMWWKGLNTARTRSFCNSFVSEASTRHVKLVPCSLSRRRLSSAIAARGLSEIIGLARSPGSGYLGAMVVGTINRMPGALEMLRSLCAVGRPVVWFDQQGIATPPVTFPHFVACRLADEQSIARVLIESCLSAGHVHAGYLGYGYAPESGSDQRQQWQIRRFEELRKEGQRVVPALSVTGSDEVVDSLRNMPADSLARTLRSLSHEGPTHCVKAVNCLRSFSGLPHPRSDHHRLWLAVAKKILMWYDALCKRGDYPEGLKFALEPLALLLNPAITVLIACNDAAARLAHQRLLAANISVPEDISMLSVDNAIDFTELPVDTVDGGAGSLGYMAFHAILEDLPSPRKRETTLVATPQLVRRDSLRPILSH